MPAAGASSRMNRHQDVVTNTYRSFPDDGNIPKFYTSFRFADFLHQKQYKISPQQQWSYRYHSLSPVSCLEGGLDNLEVHPVIIPIIIHHHEWLSACG